MLPQFDRLSYVIGSAEGFCAKPLPPFAPTVKAFLARLSEVLLKDPTARTLPDVVSFAYWCRKANIERQSAKLNGGERLRLGRGVAFHIPPTNVPVNFAYSWAFAMLAGNASVLRLPTKEFPQVPVILKAVERLFAEEAYREPAAMNAFVRYGHDTDITTAFSAVCDARIIWGGDEVVREIRKCPLPPRSVDIAFPDRTSFAVLSTSAVLELTEAALARLATGFFNDTYLMDQNACSSPRLVVWLEPARADAARERFWAAVEKEIIRRGYDLAPIRAVDKFCQACRDAIEVPAVEHLTTAANTIYRIDLGVVTSELDRRRCSCGYFYEFVTDQLDLIADAITWKYQTLTYAGVPKDDLAQFVIRHRMSGIDRIVPIGTAMDIGLVWDGYDLISTLSRTCDVQ